MCDSESADVSSPFKPTLRLPVPCRSTNSVFLLSPAFASLKLYTYVTFLSSSTDYDAEPISPFLGLYSCVTRELPRKVRKAAGSRKKKFL